MRTIDFTNFTTDLFSLRPLLSDDFRNIFSWQTDISDMYLWWEERYVLSYEQFCDNFQRRLRGFIDTALMVDIVNKAGHSTAGMIYNYKSNYIDKNTYICIYLDKQFRNKKIGTDAGYLFLKYLFSYFGFNKIYAEIFEYNEVSLHIAKRNFFIEEACLKNHRWYGNRFWNYYILSIDRDGFQRLAASHDDVVDFLQG